MKIAAISCARMASTRLPKKCILPLNGQPLIQYTIDFAVIKLKIPLFIWTRDIEIMEYTKGWCPIIYEPLALYNTFENTTFEKMQYANQIIDADYLILLQPTQPVRDEKEVKKWIKKIVDEKLDVGFTVYKKNVKKGNIIPDGYFYFWSKRYLKNKNINCRIYVIENEECFDIDTKEDLEACEKWLQKHGSY